MYLKLTIDSEVTIKNTVTTLYCIEKNENELNKIKKIKDKRIQSNFNLLNLNMMLVNAKNSNKPGSNLAKKRLKPIKKSKKDRFNFI